MRRRDEPIYPLLGLWNFGSIASPITGYFARWRRRRRRRPAHTETDGRDCRAIHAFICRRIVTGGKLLRKRRKKDERAAGLSITGTIEAFSNKIIRRISVSVCKHGLEVKRNGNSLLRRVSVK